MKIKFKKGIEPHANYELLVINGELISKERAIAFKRHTIDLQNRKIEDKEPSLGIVLYDQELIKKFSKLRPKDLPKRVVELRFSKWIRWFNGSEFVAVNWNSDQDTVEISCFPDFVNWRFPYSFTDYFNNFKYQLSLFNLPIYIEDLDANNPGLSIKFQNVLKEKAFLYQIIPYENIVNLIHQRITYYLVNGYTVIPKDFPTLSESSILESGTLDSSFFSIITSFEFPAEIKSSCEQYLLYFAQFLRDLGINTTSSLKEESGKVLFSVAPVDDIEALDRIHEALAVYLHLPSSLVTYSDSFASMRLQQQIENFQHAQKMAEREMRSSERELRLSQTVIESQDEIIHQKDSIIIQQNKIIKKITNKAVLIDSAGNKEELEEIFEGLKVGKSKFLAEQFGIHLNPATVIKTAIDKFAGKNDTTSILRLEEDSEDIE